MRRPGLCTGSAGHGRLPASSHPTRLIHVVHCGAQAHAQALALACKSVPSEVAARLAADAGALASAAALAAKARARRGFTGLDLNRQCAREQARELRRRVLLALALRRWRSAADVEMGRRIVVAERQYDKWVLKRGFERFALGVEEAKIEAHKTKLMDKVNGWLGELESKPSCKTLIMLG